MLHVSVRRRQSSGINTLLTHVNLALKLHTILIPEDGRGKQKPLTCDVRIDTFVVFDGNVQITTNF
jgi:hypothetical protein